MTENIRIKTLHDPEGKMPNWPDYWLAWANGVQGDGLTEAEAIENAKKKTACGGRSAGPSTCRQLTKENP